MRIGIIVDKFPSISETFILNKVEGLCRRGHEVVVFRNSKHNNAQLDASLIPSDLVNLTVVDVHIPSNPIEATTHLLFNPTVAFSALRSPAYSVKKKILSAIRDKYFAAHPCDIYHFEFSGLATNYLPLFKSLKGKIVVSCRGSAEKVKPVTQPGRKEELKKLFQSVDKIHCVSSDMASTVQLYGAPSEKIFVNRPAIHTSFFKPGIVKKQQEKISIFSVGRLTFQKGFLIGLLAFKQVVQKAPNVHWTIAGDGPMLEELKFYINDLGLDDHISLVGAIPKQKVLEHFHSSDIFFLPSVYEGIANVVLEAMAMELAVVSSDCSGMGEVITHGIDGMLAENYNADEMAAHILMLVNNSGYRLQLGKEARKRIENAFDIERQLNVFEQEYNNLLTPVIA